MSSRSPYVLRSQEGNGHVVEMSTSMQDIGQSADSEGKNVFELVKTLLRFKWTILLSLFVCVGVALAYLSIAPKKYSAAATLRVETYFPLIPGALREDALKQQTAEKNYFTTQVAALKSKPLAEQALSLPEIADSLKAVYGEDTPFFDRVEDDSASYKFQTKALNLYNSFFSVLPVPETSLIRVKFVTPSGELSAQLANTHARQFIQRQIDIMKSADSSNTDFLKDQLASLNEKLRKAETALASFAKKNSIVVFDGEDEIAVSQLKQAHNAVQQASAKRIELESKLKEARRLAEQDSTFLDDGAIGELRNQLGQARAEYSQLSERFLPGYPQMKELSGKINSLKSQIREQQKKIVSGLTAQYQAALDAEKQLGQELAKNNVSAYEKGRTQIEFGTLKRKYESLKELHKNVLFELQRSQLSEGGTKRTNITIEEPAAVPDKPSSPRVMLVLGLSVCGGLFLGCTLALIRDALDQSVKTREDVEEVTRMPLIGIIPSFGLAEEAQVEGPKKKKTDEDLPATSPLVNLPVAVNPYSFAAEAFRTLRARIRLSSHGADVCSLLITSPAEGEGKTTVVTNLGAIYAKEGARVLLVDADLRKMALSRTFGLDRKVPGLSDVLNQKVSSAAAIRSTGLGNLDVLPAGSTALHPSELLGSPEMIELLSELEDQYDIILIDSPPAIAVADALLLVNMVDGVLLVARSAVTNKRGLKETLQRISDAGAAFVSVCLNGESSESKSLAKSNYFAYKEAS